YEPALLGMGRADVADPGDRFVSHVLAEAVALLGRARRVERSRVAVEHRIILIGLTGHEAIESIAAPGAAGGPPLERSGSADFRRGRVVPLAEAAGCIAVKPQDFGNAYAPVRHHAAIPRITRAH